MEENQKPYLGDVKHRLMDVVTRIADAAGEAGRDPKEIQLLAVSKLHSFGAVARAIDAGQRLFGENRVLEAKLKFEKLREMHVGLRLHLIGHLQTNKVREATRIFDVIETLDRPRLAAKIAKERDRSGCCPELFIQINTGEEPQKSGIQPIDADKFIRTTRDVMELPVTGLMCIPPVNEEPESHFASLADFADRNGIAKVSMGMSSDFEKAIKLGSTEIRVGTRIFGRRDPALLNRIL